MRETQKEEAQLRLLHRVRLSESSYVSLDDRFAVAN